MDTYTGKLTGKLYQSREEMLHYETREAMRREKLTPAQKAFAKLSADEVRELAESEARTNQQKEDDVRGEQNAFVWVEAHPEFVRCPENRDEIEFYLSSRGITLATFDILEEAYNALRAAGRVKVDQTVIAEQAKQKHQTRAKEIKEKRTPLTEEEMYALPLNEVYKRGMDPDYAQAKLSEPDF